MKLFITHRVCRHSREQIHLSLELGILLHNKLEWLHKAEGSLSTVGIQHLFTVIATKVNA